MGIKDLLRFMKPYIEPIHIEKYAGKRVGIDAYSWLHKGAYSCSMELCLNSEGDKKLQFLNYFMHRIQLLRHYKVTPVVVFDGGSIPCKAATEDERQRRRKANRELAMQKLNEGDVKAASELFQRGVSITPAIAHQLIKILRSENIEFVVAPYEADAQLAYLSSLEVEKGGVVAVITEDSDLMAYGCKAIIFKMDRYGSGEEILFEKVFDSADCVPSFRGFTEDLFIGMCVLAGCDFLPSVPGIGIKKAYSLISKYRNLDRALSVLKIEKGNLMPEDYPKSFHEAVAVFQHALIYDTTAKKLTHLKPLPKKLLQSLEGNLDFLGPEIPPSVATAIATGKLDPTNMEAFDHTEKPVAVPESSQHWQKKATALSVQKKCFRVFSSKETSVSDNPILQQTPAQYEAKCLKEAATFEKLVLPSETSQDAEGSGAVVSISLKVPDNNPFRIEKAKKKKCSDLRMNITEDASVLTYVEKSEIVSVRADILPEAATEDKQCTEGLHNVIELDRESEVTDVEVTDVGDQERALMGSSESQESVNSRPKRIATNSKQDKGGNKPKRKKIKSSVSNNSSILNFFTRV
ncbi:exonuclease 1 isoform X2 [Punica granatum]|uniref:Exonuclease 1 n=1 Tax=Punica granatum TaxID=22663 RepID=A0A6P8EM15_PUNGR|nr:exonuclease 1 isoform X2 [Punica granatum]